MLDRDVRNWLIGAGFMDVPRRAPDGTNAPKRVPRDLEGLIECPLLPVRDTVLFPRMVTPLLVGRDRSVRAVEAAELAQEPLVVAAQRNQESEDPLPEDVYALGVEVAIVRTLRMPDGTTSVLTQGQRRVEIVEFSQVEPYYRVRARPIYEPSARPPATEALMRAVLALFEKVIQLNRSLPENAYVFAMNVDEPGWLADVVASAIELDVPDRQELLEMLDPTMRLQRLSILLAKELDVLELEDHIHSQVQREVDKSQREFYLREQMKAIQTELGEGDLHQQDMGTLKQKIADKKFPDEVRAKAEKELERLAAMPSMSPEAGIIRTYLDWLLELPWGVASSDNLDVSHAAEVLESRHYGLPKAKDRILEYIAVRKLAADKMRSPILCFVGPPGTGKTSLGKSIAEALGRKFVRVSLGGIRDEAEIRGHRRTYIGALPGRILQTMRRAETVNPLFMLDEIDKVGNDFQGDPSAALLEVLDPEQNFSFSDHYLEVPYDLSKVLFVTTANWMDPIPPALRDRMEVIEFPGYIEEEKLAIARGFLIPRQFEEHGLTSEHLTFGEKAIRSVIREYTYEAGVRNLEREIANICRKTARRVAEGKRIQHNVTPSVVTRFLGPPKFDFGVAEQQDQIGTATGVAVTDAGGDLQPLEVSLMEGKGMLLLTGQLGEVMQESAQAALSYTRSRARALGLNPRIFEKTDIHIHAPEGAVPKDGPSAGVTIATALVSAFTRRPVRRQVAMTGEITLRGRVLPIGGLKEKVLAAHRAGLTTMILPKKNKKDMVEIPKRVLRDLQFVLVEQIDEVLDAALLPPVEPPVSARKRTANKSNRQVTKKRKNLSRKSGS